MKTDEQVFEVAPPHLCEERNVIGGVLRAELKRRPPKTKLEFSMLQAEQKRRALRNTLVGSTALLGAAALFLLLPGSPSISNDGASWVSGASDFSPQVEAEPEEWRGAALPAAPNERKLGIAVAGPNAEQPAAPAASPVVPAKQRVRSTATTRPDGPSAVATSSNQQSSLKDCSAQAQAGKYQQASDCYGSIAQGGGFSAELANLEQVRVLSRALVQPDKALRALDDYDRRFPSGALRGEAALTRVDLLASTGQEERLIVEVDKILKSNWAPERHAELLLLKAEALVRGKNCELALRATDESERAGGPAQGIARVRRQCGP